MIAYQAHGFKWPAVFLINGTGDDLSGDVEMCPVSL
ncbi:hypothetical protein PH5382_02244 [Phaeobacter sp. CECT 5382]|nr:hypothetical protein PH5382_02244 [Phaeobacter sp. CECT 5382]